MISVYIGKILYVLSILSFISFPIIANVYAWKHDETAGKVVSSVTAVTLSSLIISMILITNNKHNILATILIFIAVLGILSFPVLANIYAWKHDETAGIAVSTLTGASLLFLIISRPIQEHGQDVKINAIRKLALV
jgi:NADH:ubiquinone oxidoreductase subunit 3 (subunit A)